MLDKLKQQPLAIVAALLIVLPCQAHSQYSAPAVVPMQNYAPQQIQQMGQASQQLGRALSSAATATTNNASPSSFAASAQRSYISCVIPPNKKVAEQDYDFTLDENTGTVSFYWPNETQFLRAFFSADKVFWDQPFYGMLIHRMIDRVTLEYTETTSDGHKTTPPTKGTCKVVTPPPGRKF